MSKYMKILFGFLILSFLINCDGDYNKTIEKINLGEVNIIQPSPKSRIYHLKAISKQISIDEKFIKTLYSKNNELYVKYYKNENGYIINDSTFGYKILKFVVKEDEITKRDYDSITKKIHINKIWDY